MRESNLNCLFLRWHTSPSSLFLSRNGIGSNLFDALKCSSSACSPQSAINNSLMRHPSIPLHRVCQLNSFLTSASWTFAVIWIVPSSIYSTNLTFPHLESYASKGTGPRTRSSRKCFSHVRGSKLYICIAITITILIFPCLWIQLGNKPLIWKWWTIRPCWSARTWLGVRFERHRITVAWLRQPTSKVKTFRTGIWAIRRVLPRGTANWLGPLPTDGGRG